VYTDLGRRANKDRGRANRVSNGTHPDIATSALQEG
jgi:hypothetical protein